MDLTLSVIFMPKGFCADKTPTDDKNAFFDEILYNQLLGKPYETLYGLGFAVKNDRYSPSLSFLRTISERFASELSHDPDLNISRAAKPADTIVLTELLRAMPFAIGAEYVNLDWLSSVWAKLSDVFNSEIAAFEGDVAEYFRSKNETLQIVGRVFFHLVEHKDEEYPFAFLATYSGGNTGSVVHMPLKNALIEHKNDQDKLLQLLSTVGKASEQSEFISDLVESGELFSPLRFTSNEAYTFLKEAPLYEDCGIVCRMPNWWRGKNNARMSVSIGTAAPAGIGLDAIMSFDVSLFIGDAAMNREEVEKLLAETNGLSVIKGKWVEVDHDKLREALAVFDKIDDLGGLSFSEVMRMQLGLGEDLSQNKHIAVEITNGEWLNSFKIHGVSGKKLEKVKPSQDFCARLRHYQDTGFKWLLSLRSLGFGSLLADDMGLGKTIQTLALLDYLRKSGGIRALLIIPASLIANWQKEAEKFAPKLRVRVLHAQNRNFTPDEADIFITTYGMTLRIEDLQKTDWDLVILDEAKA
ncbi:MAG: hypothetical protein LBT31_04045 [Synergistaceae bacterium]|jgi:non-specific serine/threonine protein kinase|nr:hypothetical protein [Synergistaceae bacterium]